MPRLSIIVPHLGNDGQFEDTLASVLQNQPRDSEILVVHPASYRDPYDLSEEASYIAVPGEASLVAMLNAGLAEAAGDVLHVLSHGVEVSDGWTAAALVHFLDPQVGCVSPWIVDRNDRERLVSVGVGYGTGGTRRLVGAGARTRSAVKYVGYIVGPTNCAGLYRTSAVRELGGFDEAVGDDLADVDIAMTLRQFGYRCEPEPDCRLVGSADVESSRWSFASGRHAERLYRRHSSATGKVKLAHMATLSVEAATGLTRPLSMIARFAGRASAAWEKTGNRQSHSHLRSATSVERSMDRDEAEQVRQSRAA